MTDPTNAPSFPNARDCKHGQLRRSCEICELEREVEESQARIAELEAEYEDGKRDWLDSLGEMRARRNDQAERREVAEAKVERGERALELLRSCPMVSPDGGPIPGSWLVAVDELLGEDG